MDWEKTNPNEPKQSQTNPISEKPKMNVNKVLTKDYENQPLRRLPENKPNFETALSVKGGAKTQKSGGIIYSFVAEPKIGAFLLIYR